MGIFAVALGAAAMTVVPFKGFDTRLWAAAVGSVLVGAGCLTLMRIRARRGRMPIMARLGPATAVLYSLSFGVFGLAWLVPQTGGREVVNPAQIAPAIATAMFGLVALTFGYLIGAPRLAVRRGRRMVSSVLPHGPMRLRVPSMAIILYAVGTAGRAVTLASGQYGYFQDASQSLSNPSSSGQGLSALEVFATLGVVAAAIDHFHLSHSTRTRVTLVVLVALETVVGVASASKQQVLFAIVAVALVHASSRWRVRARTIVVGVLLISMLFAFTAEYRNTIRKSERGRVAPSAAVDAIPSVAARTARNASLKTLGADGPSAVAQRLRQVDNVAIVRQKTPSVIPYRPWTQLVTGPAAAFVPRVLWPSKPILSTGREFSLDYYELPPSIYSASAVTLPGDLYRHGGLFPVAVGMAVFGVVLNLVDRVFGAARDPRRLIVYVPVFLYLIKLENDVTVFVVGFVQLLIIVSLTSWLVFAPADRAARRGRASAATRPALGGDAP